MSPRTPLQFEEIREEKKKLIMQVGLKLFARDGFHTTPISRIAKKAEISKGLIYNYFESKEELLKEIIFRGIQDFLQFFDPDHNGILTNEELLHFISMFFETIKKNLAYWKLFFSLMVQAPVLRLVEKEIWAVFDPFFKLLHNYFEKEGYKDPTAEVYFFQSTLDGVGMTYVSDPDNYPFDAVKKKILSMYSKN